MSDAGVDAFMLHRSDTRSLVDLSCSIVAHFIQVYRSRCEDAFMERITLPAELTQRIFSFVVELFFY
jgi:hypothetical protein